MTIPNVRGETRTLEQTDIARNKETKNRNKGKIKANMPYNTVVVPASH